MRSPQPLLHPANEAATEDSAFDIASAEGITVLDAADRDGVTLTGSPGARTSFAASLNGRDGH